MASTDEAQNGEAQAILPRLAALYQLCWEGNLRGRVRLVVARDGAQRRIAPGQTNYSYSFFA